MSKVESGERRVDLVEFVLWCQALGVEPAPLVDQLARSIGIRVPAPTVRRPLPAIKLPQRR